MREKIEIIFDKHDGKLVRLEDYNKLKKEFEDLKEKFQEYCGALPKEQK